MAIVFEMPEDLFEYEPTGEPGKYKPVLPTKVVLKCGCALTISWQFNAEGELFDIWHHGWTYPRRLNLAMYWGGEMAPTHHHTNTTENLLFQDVKAELMRRYQLRKWELQDGPSTPNPA